MHLTTKDKWCQRDALWWSSLQFIYSGEYPSPARRWAWHLPREQHMAGVNHCQRLQRCSCPYSGRKHVNTPTVCGAGVFPRVHHSRRCGRSEEGKLVLHHFSGSSRLFFPSPLSQGHIPRPKTPSTHPCFGFCFVSIWLTVVASPVTFFFFFWSDTRTVRKLKIAVFDGSPA